MTEIKTKIASEIRNSIPHTELLFLQHRSVRLLRAGRPEHTSHHHHGNRLHWLHNGHAQQEASEESHEPQLRLDFVEAQSEQHDEVGAGETGTHGNDPRHDIQPPWKPALVTGHIL